MTRPAEVGRLPHEPGVYRFRDGRGTPLYLGRARDLRRRVGSYWSDLRDRPRLARMVAQVAGVEALVCDSEHEAAWAERCLLQHRRPRWNRTRGGLESELYVELDTSTTSPGLAAVYEPVEHPELRHFGPYLGGRRVRAAIAAMTRVHPLERTREARTASERELARLTTLVAHRDDLVAALVAVLEKRPDAVAALRTELERRRDAAAAEQYYEAAARLQEELDAVDWVSAPQRFAGPAAPDATASAWCDGVLVGVRVRAGRLTEWRQQASRETGVGADGPPEWTPFVRRGAELAAALQRVGAGASGPHAQPTADHRLEHPGQGCAVPGEGGVR